MTTGEATGKPPAYREFSLVFEPPDDRRRINFMRDVRKDEWDISKLADPIYFYQPDVEPTPDGGRVRQVQQNQSWTKASFRTADRKVEDVDQQDWVMLSSDGKEFAATCDTLNDRAVIYQRDENTFALSFISQSLRVVEKFHRDSTIDPEALRRRHQLELQEGRRLMGIAGLQEELINEKHQKKLEEVERINMDLDTKSDEDDKGRGSDDGGVDGLDIDWDDLFDDDKEDSGPELVSEPSSSDDELMHEEEEEHKEEEDAQKKVRPVNVDGTPITTEKIVKRIFEDYVTEDELVSYMSEMGMCTQNQLLAKFRNTGKLKSAKQKEVFVDLVRRKLAHTEVNGQKMLRLKRAKRH